MSEYTFFLWNKFLALGVNCMVLVWLFLAMYRASLHPDTFTSTFFTTLFTLLIPTILAGYICKKLLYRRQGAVS